mmetsp:Transcript_22753/g.53735  ORF Transcript_22753/g.53735 Transcript_22753/m.53735 type:complete len:259 (+) Transcript_22753:2019-2795(+)
MWNLRRPRIRRQGFISAWRTQLGIRPFCAIKLSKNPASDTARCRCSSMILWISSASRTKKTPVPRLPIGSFRTAIRVGSAVLSWKRLGRESPTKFLHSSLVTSQFMSCDGGHRFKSSHLHLLRVRANSSLSSKPSNACEVQWNASSVHGRVTLLLLLLLSLPVPLRWLGMAFETISTRSVLLASAAAVLALWNLRRFVFLFWGLLAVANATNGASFPVGRSRAVSTRVIVLRPPLFWVHTPSITHFQGSRTDMKMWFS